MYSFISGKSCTTLFKISACSFPFCFVASNEMSSNRMHKLLIPRSKIAWILLLSIVWSIDSLTNPGEIPKINSMFEDFADSKNEPKFNRYSSE